MNRIYWDIDKIAMLTDHLDATAHSHGMIQFFLCLEGDLQIKVAGEVLVCPCIAVNQNVRHSFRAGRKNHLTMVLDPTSPLALRLSRLMEGKTYCVFGETKVQALLPPAQTMVQTFNADTYHAFIQALHGVLQADPPTPMDDRIRGLLNILENCDCHEHAIEKYADSLCLSPSRLSHLFSEKAGISLKSYLTLHQLQRAFREILQGSSITDAAMNAGFDSPSHFASTVKRLMGMPARATVKDSEFLKVF